MQRDEVPLGFSMALAQNPDAMQKFAMLSEEKKEANNRWYTFCQVKAGNARIC